MSHHLLKQKQRDINSLETYDRYQEIWYKNVQKFINSRDRLNRAGIHKNHRENKLQSRHDVTLQDRLEQINVEKQNIREVLGSHFTSQNRDRDWEINLRNYGDHDHEQHGIKLLNNSFMRRNKMESTPAKQNNDEEKSIGFESIQGNINLMTTKAEDSSFFESITNSMNKPQNRCVFPIDPN